MFTRKTIIVFMLIGIFLFNVFAVDFHNEYITIDYDNAPAKFVSQSGDSIELYDFDQDHILYIPQKVSKEDLIQFFGKNPDTILFGSRKHSNEITHIWNYKDFFIAIAIRDNENLLMVYWRFFNRIGLNGYKQLPWEREYVVEQFGKPNVVRKEFLWYEIDKGMRFELDPFNVEDPNSQITGFLIYGKSFILHYD